MLLTRTIPRFLLRTRGWWWLLLLVLFAVWLRWPGLDKQVWGDETLSLREYLPYYDNWILDVTGASRRAYTISYLFFWLSHLLMVWGSLNIVRLPYLIIGTIGIIAMWWLGRIWRSYPVALIGTALLASWPAMAYWHTILRYYAPWLTFSILLICCCELYRTKGTAKAFIGMLALTPIACLCHVIAILLLLMPWLYVFHAAVRSAWLGRREGLRRALRSLFPRFAQETMALGLVSLLIVLCNRSPNALMHALDPSHTLPGSESTWSAETARGLSPEVATKLRAAGREDLLATQAPIGRKPISPTPALAKQLIGEGLRLAFDPRKPAPERLLHLQPSAGLYGVNFPQSLGGGAFMDVNNIHWKRIQALLLLVGMLTLLVRSPGLGVGMWFYILTSSMLLEANESQVSLSDRYFIVSMLFVVITMLAGLQSLLALARLPLRRFSLRLDAAVVCLGAPVLAAWICFQLAPDVQRRVKIHSNENRRFYEYARDTYHSGGAIILSQPADELAFYRDLEQLRSSRFAMSKVLPRRGTPGEMLVLFDYANGVHRGSTLLEILNEYEVALFQTNDPSNKWSPLTNVQTYTSTTWQTKPVLHQLIAPAHRLFVTRGRTAAPLLPRYRNREKPTIRYDVECLFEVPGTYVVGLVAPSGSLVADVRFTGSKQPAMPGATSAERLLNFYHLAGLTPPTSASLVMLGHVLRLPSQILDDSPFTMRTDPRAKPCEPHECDGTLAGLAIIESPPQPMHVTPLAIEWKGTLTGDPWLVVHRIAEPMVPFTRHLAMGRAVIAQTTDAFILTVPLRMETTQSLRLEAHAYVQNPDFREVVPPARIVLTPSNRCLRQGDWVTGGPLPVPRQQAASFLMQPLQWFLYPFESLSNVSPVMRRSELSVAGSPGGQIGRRIAYLRFTNQRGALEMQLGQ